MQYWSLLFLFVAEFVATFSAALVRASSYQFLDNSWTPRVGSVLNVTRKRWRLSPETTMTCRVPIVNNRRLMLAVELLRHFIFSLSIVYLPNIRIQHPRMSAWVLQITFTKVPITFSPYLNFTLILSNIICWARIFESYYNIGHR